MVGVMTHPAEEARKHIMAALEACQEEPSLAEALEQLAQSLAQAQGKLFKAAAAPETSPESVEMMRRAMEHLAQALKTLQDVRGDHSATGIAASAIARALKLLHPVVREARVRGSKISTPPPPAKARGHAASGATASIDVNTVLSMNTDHQFYTGFSENIEEGGIFVATFEPEPVGEAVIVNFKLPGGRPVTARGVVQWVRDYNPKTPEVAPGMGLKFTDLLPSDKRAIEEFTKTRAPMFYDD
jgi:uncharacterized protein (TIGR02266 family)